MSTRRSAVVLVARVDLAHPTSDAAQHIPRVAVAVALEPLHGWAIAQRLEQVSGDVLQVSEGSLYPALSRLSRGLAEAAYCKWIAGSGLAPP